jgi:hypothetical protein
LSKNGGNGKRESIQLAERISIALVPSRRGYRSLLVDSCMVPLSIIHKEHLDEIDELLLVLMEVV